MSDTGTVADMHILKHVIEVTAVVDLHHADTVELSFCEGLSDCAEERLSNRLFQ